MSDIVGTKEAAEMLEVSRQWVLMLIGDERLEAKLIGTSYAIDTNSIKTYRREVQKKNDLDDLDDLDNLDE
jgi:excisionase family DNA binding protein